MPFKYALFCATPIDVFKWPRVDNLLFCIRVSINVPGLFSVLSSRHDGSPRLHDIAPPPLAPPRRSARLSLFIAPTFSLITIASFGVVRSKPSRAARPVTGLM